MNLLIIGNGFDLAHGLPTRYTDFLKYCRDYNDNEPVSLQDNLNIEFAEFVNNNIWLKYFLSITVDLDDTKTWIDFEKEIARVIHDIDQADPQIEWMDYFNHPSEKILELKDVSEEIVTFFTLFCNQTDEDEKYVITIDRINDIETLVEYLYNQLHYFARAFEIYCLKVNDTEPKKEIITSELKKQIEAVVYKKEMYAHKARYASGYINRKNEVVENEKLKDQYISEQVSLSNKINLIDYLSMSKFDYVLSFNYTNTYERLYGTKDKTDYCYIHGKALKESKDTNIIFGIDDDLSQGEESRNFKWVKFKKYFQRIIMKTGSEYKDWISQKDNTLKKIDSVYIVGHSLDKTDIEVFYDIFKGEDYKITVYYYNQDDFVDKVKKVIQILAYDGMNGRDELIRRVHGRDWSIRFVDQYDEKDGLFIR